jgi:hypothetical protein
MKDRQHLALMAPEGSIGAELGVAKGRLTLRIMQLNHFGAFHAVDKWNDHHNEAEYEGVVDLLAGFEKLDIHRMGAKEWLDTVPDSSLGFVYIDCYANNGQENGSILEAAWPKVIEGGLFAGDDYDVNYQTNVRAVDAFAAEVDRKVCIYDDHIKNGLTKSVFDRSKSWYFRK